MKQHNITYHNVSRETFESIDNHIASNQRKLEKYLDLLLWWNKRVNLVSRSVSRETLQEHIRHSILLTEIPGFKQTERIIDAGTGGGLPGVPLAIVNPQKNFVLNDIVKKKLMAVKQIVKNLNLSNTATLSGSIETVELNEPVDIISKHAFKINALYQMVFKKDWNRLIFYKGSDYKNELEGINHPLEIDVYRLFKNSRSEFYKGKLLVILSKSNHAT